MKSIILRKSSGSRSKNTLPSFPYPYGTSPENLAANKESGTDVKVCLATSIY